MSVLRLAFPPGPAWSQEVQLDGRAYQLRGQYNTRSDQWTLDILTRTGEPIILGKRLVLDFPLLGDETDPRLPPGGLYVVDPLGRSRGDPCRGCFTDDLRLVYAPL